MNNIIINPLKLLGIKAKQLVEFINKNNEERQLLTDAFNGRTDGRTDEQSNKCSDREHGKRNLKLWQTNSKPDRPTTDVHEGS